MKNTVQMIHPLKKIIMRNIENMGNNLDEILVRGMNKENRVFLQQMKKK
jgi:hypothetical protein